MSAQSGPDVAALLVDTHRWLGGGPIGDCACGWRRAWNDKRGEYIQHATHLDQVIREAYADWLTEIAGEWAQLSRDQRSITWRELAIGRAWAATRLTAVADLLRGQA